ANATTQSTAPAFENEPGAQNDVSTATQAHADRLSEALARTGGGEAHWTMPDGSASRVRRAPVVEPTAAEAEPSPTLAQVLALWLERLPAPPAAPATADDAAALSRRELFERL